MQVDRIVVTGLGAVTALGPDVSSLWQGMQQGRCGIGKIKLLDVEGCRVDIGAEVTSVRRLSKRRSAAQSRAATMALDAATQALQQGAWKGSERARLGLVLGSTGAGTAELERYLERTKRSGKPTREALLAAYPKRSCTDWVASELRAKGPRATINTACSSGAVAISTAADWLRMGLCEAVLAGGAEELLRYTITGFSSLRIVDTQPCRPFDRARAGLSLGEGAAFLLLERESEAKGRGVPVIAELAGTGMSCDAFHLTAPDEQGRGASEAMLSALRDAGIGPEQLGFINAHGTGTPLNDRSEVSAIHSILGAGAAKCPVHSAKSSVGHCLGAAGAIEAVIAVLSLGAGLVPHTVGLQEPESDLLDFVRGQPRRVEASYCLSNSFGFGGNNASLVFGRGASS